MQQEFTAQEDWPVVEFPDVSNLSTEDGVPFESPWHRDEINLLIVSLISAWGERDDYFVGGNMFIYFSKEQALNRDYRGPDFFVVKNVDGKVARGSWIVWEEGGRYPNVIVELLSPSTAELDKTVKKSLYEQTFRTPEYYGYDPLTKELFGWRLADGEYIDLEKDEAGRLWSKELQVWLGLWEGTYLNRDATWVRFFDEDGRVVPTQVEAALQEVEVERGRAEQAEAEVARLREELGRYQTE
ncbi:MAG: Uma2 family endonuclease [Candidatus Promineifilaceae bacterium]